MREPLHAAPIGIAETLRSGASAGTESVKYLWKLLGALQSATHWEERELAPLLGCSLHTDGVAGERVAHSVEYLSWLVTLCESVDLPADRRAVVVGAFDVVAGAPGSTPPERLVAAREAFARPAPRGSGELSSSEYLGMGEISTAWRVAARGLEAGAAYERARRLDALESPFAGLACHLDPRRVRLLEGDNAITELGVNVARRMARHREECSACPGARRSDDVPVLRQAA